MKEYYVEKTPPLLIKSGMEFFLNEVPSLSVGAEAHIHEAIEILLVEEGSFTFFAGDESFSAKKGDIFLIRSNEIHSTIAKNGKNNAYFVLKFKPSFIFDFAIEELAVGYALRFIIKGAHSVTLWRAEEESTKNIFFNFSRLIDLYKDGSPCHDMAMKLSAGEVILAFLKEMIAREEECGIRDSSYLSDGTASSQIYKAIKYINRHYFEQISALDCAGEVGMSYSYFSRSFKRITGKTFKEYLNEVRIKHAESLLTTTDASVTSIALECGYNNVSYFIMVYKALKGKTPFDYRRNLR